MENKFNKELEKYLTKRSFLGKWNINPPSGKLFDFVICVPAIAELENLKKLLESLSQNNSALFNEFLILIVVNNTRLSSAEVKLNNVKTIKYLKNIINSNGKAYGGLNIKYIDAATEGNELPVKTGGVGLARKLGCDAALRLLKTNNSGIIWLDADCTVSKNYFDEILKFFKRNGNAGYFKFEHPPGNNPLINSAIVQYELFLHYYVLGLRLARSPFAFHTVGSTIMFTPEVYVKNGGMNLRKAGEDFYFLEKIAKFTDVKLVNTGVVYPSPRPSRRVPFGTGRTIKNFIENKKKRQLFYSIHSFEILKQWNEIFLRINSVEPEVYLKEASRISERLKEFLIKNNFIQWWKKVISNAASDAQLMKQKIFWFDGFRTLKLFHYLREKDFPDVSLPEAFEGLALLDDEVRMCLKGLNLLDFDSRIELLKRVRLLVFR